MLGTLLPMPPILTAQPDYWRYLVSCNGQARLNVTAACSLVNCAALSKLNSLLSARRLLLFPMCCNFYMKVHMMKKQDGKRASYME